MKLDERLVNMLKNLEMSDQRNSTRVKAFEMHVTNTGLIPNTMIPQIMPGIIFESRTKHKI